LSLEIERLAFFPLDEVRESRGITVHLVFLTIRVAERKFTAIYLDNAQIKLTRDDVPRDLRGYRFKATRFRV